MRRFTLTSDRCTPAAVEKDPDQVDGQGNSQGTKGEPSKQELDEKASDRQRLNCMSGLRIRPKAIKLTSGDYHRSGGRADVAPAKFRHWYSISGQLVAVKRVRSIHTKKARDGFIHEVEVLKELSHTNVVRFIGFVEEFENGTAWIISSWEPNGNISEFLARRNWEIPERVSLIKDTFEGIKYLHTRQPPICHGNLKSFNVLVNSSCRAVITGFGSADVIDRPEEEATGKESGQEPQATPSAQPVSAPIHIGVAGNKLTLTGPAWSLNWDAPEVMDGKCPSLSNDIWALGWVCWEVMTDDIPFSELDSSGIITLTVTQGEDASPGDPEPLGHPVALNSLMMDCWAFDPKARPSVSRCCDELQWMPSTPPSVGDLSGPKVSPTSLVLQKARMHYDQCNYEKSVSLFQQALSLAKSAGDRTATADALVWLGGCYRAQSKYPLAEESYIQAQKIYARVGNNIGQGNTLVGLGQIYNDQSQLNQAEVSYTRAQEIYTRAASDMGRANTLYGLGRMYHTQSKHTQADELCTQAQEIYTRLGSDLGRGNALYMLGDIYRLQFKYAKAEEFHTRAQELYGRVGSDVGRADTLLGLGQLYNDQSSYTQAEESYTKAQKIYTRTGSDLSLANTLVELGRVCNAQSKHTHAEAFCTQAQEIYTRIGNDLGQANVLDVLGNVYRLQFKYAAAEESYTQAQQIYSRSGYDLGRANTLFNQGQLYYSQSKYTQAEESYNRAQEEYARLGNDRGRAWTLYCIGHLRSILGRNTEAAARYTEARDLFSQIGMTKEVEDVSHWLANVPNHDSART